MSLSCSFIPPCIQYHMLHDINLIVLFFRTKTGGVINYYTAIYHTPYGFADIDKINRCFCHVFYLIYTYFTNFQHHERKRKNENMSTILRTSNLIYYTRKSNLYTFDRRVTRSFKFKFFSICSAQKEMSSPIEQIFSNAKRE